MGLYDLNFIEIFPLAKSKHAKEVVFKFEKDSDMS